MFVVQILLVVAILYHLALAVITVWRTRTFRVGRNFAWYLVFIATWMACVGADAAALRRCLRPAHGACHLCLHHADGRQLALVLRRFSMGFSSNFRRFALLLTLAGSPWVVVAWSRWIIISVTFNGDHIDTEIGPLLLPFTIWILTCAASGAIHLWEKQKQARGVERMQIRYILLGCIGLAVTAGIIDLVLPLLTGSTRYAHFGPLSALFVTTTTSLSIVRHRLLDLNIMLRASVVYTLTLGALALVFAVIVWLVEDVLTLKLVHPYTVISIVAFLIALGFQPLRACVQRVLDQRLFYHGLYDYRLTLREACHALAEAREQGQVAQVFIDAVQRALAPQNSAVFLPGYNGLFARAAGHGEWVTLPFALSVPNIVLDYARDHDEVLLAEELIRQPRPCFDVGECLRNWGVTAALPLLAGGQFCGLIVLGDTQTGEVYAYDDLGLLRILGKQAALALDNVRHVDEVVMMNEYHSLLLNSMQDGVIAIDSDGRVTTFNRAAERITGMPITRAMGRQLGDLTIIHLPVHATGEQPIETTITAIAGNEVPVLLTVTPFTRNWERDESFLLVFRDISTLHALRREKMQAERFSSMGAMAAGLAHEMEAPLEPIQHLSDQLLTRYDDADFRAEFSHTVVNEVERINRLVGQLLDLVRKPSSERSLVDMEQLMQRLLEIVTPECVRQTVLLHVEVTPNLPRVIGAVGQLSQAVLNAMMFAVQGMPDGGVLTIALAPEDGNLLCRISDTGPALTDEELTRLFDPSLQTARGSSVGLALTCQFLRAHGGDVQAGRTPEGGLLVTLMLPAIHFSEDAPLPEFSDES